MYYTNTSGGDRLGYIMIPFALAAVFYDFADGRIPNRLLAAGTVVGAGYMLYTVGLQFIFQMVAGAVIPFVLLFALFHIGALGGGDVKLLSFLGSLFGLRILEVIFCAFVFGACQSLIRLLLNHPFFQKFHIKKKHTIHFALSIFLAAVYVAFFRNWCVV